MKKILLLLTISLQFVFSHAQFKSPLIFNDISTNSPVKFDFTGKTGAISGELGGIRLFNYESSKITNTLEANINENFVSEKGVSNFTFHPREYILSYYSNNTDSNYNTQFYIIFYDYKNNIKKDSVHLKTGEGYIKNKQEFIQYTQDGNYIIAGLNRRIIIIETKTKNIIYDNAELQEEIIRLAFFDNKKNLLFTAGDTKKINIINIEKKQIVKTINIDFNIYTSSFYQEKNILFLAGNSSNILKLDINKFEIDYINTHIKKINSVVTFNNKLFASGNTENNIAYDKSSIFTYNLNTNTKEKGIIIPDDNIMLSINKQNKMLAVTGYYKEAITFYALENDDKLIELILQKGHLSNITHLSFSNDGNILASGDEDGIVKIWDLRFQKEIKTIKSSDDGITQISFTPNGKQIAVADGSYNHIKIYDILTGEIVRRINCENSNFALISPNGKYIAVTNENKTIIVFDFATQEKLYEITDEYSIISLKFSKDSKLLAAGTLNGKVILCDIVKKNTILNIEKHENAVLDIDFSKDNNTFTSIDYEGNICLTDISNGSTEYIIKAEKNKNDNLYTENEKLHTDCRHHPLKVSFFSDGITTLSHFNLCATYICKWNTNTSKGIFDDNNFKYLSDTVRLNILTDNFDYNQRQDLLATSTGNKTIDILDSRYFNKKYDFKDRLLKIEDVSFSKRKNIFAVSVSNLNSSIFKTSIIDFLNFKKITELDSENFKNDFICLDKKGEKISGFSSFGSNTFDLKKNQNEKKSEKYIYTDIVKYSKNLKYYALSTSDTLKLFDNKNDKLLFETNIQKCKGIGSRKFFMKFDDTENILVFMKNCTTIEAFNITENKKKLTYISGKEILSCEFHDNNNLIIVAEDNAINLLNIYTKNIITLIEKSKDFYFYENQIAFNKNNNMLVLACYSSIIDKDFIRCIDLNKKQIIHDFYLKKNYFRELGFTKKGSKLMFFNDILQVNFKEKIRFYNIEKKQEIADYFLFTDGNNLLVSPDGYYFASSKLVSGLIFSIGNNIFPFEQLDLKLNRPDILLKRFGIADNLTVIMYENAYKKRLKKMNFTENMLASDFHIPTIKILNRDTIAFETQIKELKIDLKAFDSKYKLDRINIWVNDIPIYGINGIDLRENKASEITKNIKVLLSEGNNKIQVSVLNQKAAESYKETVYINYEPKEKTKPNLYIVAIGVSKYENEQYNLTYAAKDATDLSSAFNAKNDKFGKVETVKILDEEATLENIQAVKEKLMQTGVEDEVIVFFAGHGLLNDSLDYYLATHNINFEKPSENGLPYEELENLLDGIPARKKMLLIDACHSGEVDKDEIEKTEKELIAENTTTDYNVVFRSATPFGLKPAKSKIGLKNSFELMKELFADLRRGTGAMVISSAGGGEFAFEGEQWNNGVFTYSVIQALQTKKADINKDGVLQVSELRNFVQDNVKELTNGKQNPTSRRENLEFDFGVW